VVTTVDVVGLIGVAAGVATIAAAAQLELHTRHIYTYIQIPVYTSMSTLPLSLSCWLNNSRAPIHFMEASLPGLGETKATAMSSSTHSTDKKGSSTGLIERHQISILPTRPNYKLEVGGDVDDNSVQPQ
jgi:hypothetical protein